MSNFIPMVSSSPPPMDDGGFDWDDDDDFGTFTGADESEGSSQTTENKNHQPKSQDTKIPLDTDPNHDTNTWHTQNGEILEDSVNCHSNSLNLSSKGIEENNSLDDQTDTRPKNIEIDSNACDITDIPKTDIEEKGPLTDSGLYSADVSPIQQADQAYNDQDINQDLELSNDSDCSNNELEGSDHVSQDPDATHIVQNVDEKSEISAADSQNDSAETCDNERTLQSETCIKSTENSSQDTHEHSKNIEVDTKDISDLSNSDSTHKNIIPTDTISSSILKDSHTEHSKESELGTESCDKIHPSSGINTSECTHVESRTVGIHGNDLRDDHDVQDTYAQNSVVETSIEIKHIETSEQLTIENTEELSHETKECHYKSGDKTDTIENIDELENKDERQFEELSVAEVTSSAHNPVAENTESGEWGDFDTGIENSAISDEMQTNSSSDMQEVTIKSSDIFEQEHSDQLHSVDHCESKSVEKKNDLKSENVNSEKAQVSTNKNEEDDFGEFNSSDLGMCDDTSDPNNKDSDDFGNFAPMSESTEKVNVGDFSAKNESNEKDTVDDFGDFSATNGVQDKIDDDEFGDFNATNDIQDKTDDNDDEFGDFNTTGDIPLKNDDEFGDFNATNDIEDKTDDDFGDFNTNGDFGAFDKASGGDFAAFGDDTTTAAAADTQEGPSGAGNDWASFSESQTVEAADFVPEDDEEWAAFNEETPVTATPPASRPIPQNMSQQEKLLFAVTAVFPGLMGDTAADLSVTDLDNVVREGSRSQGELSVWLQIRGVHSTNAVDYQYTKSHWNDRLYSCLRVDTRNVLIGHKKTPVPIFASGLTMLEPTKGSSAAPLKPEVLVDTSKSSNTDHLQSQETIPPAQFDWSSSGLKNPLEADNKTLNLDFLIQDQAVKSNALESEFLGTDSFVTPVKPSMQPLESILANMKSVSTLKPVNDSQNISQEAFKVVDSLPNLSFMRSKVLMFPLKLDQ